MIYINTNGILDKCGCGGYAGFEGEGTGSTFKVRAGCSECGDRTEYQDHWGLSAIQWNLKQRKLAGRLKAIPATVIPKFIKRKVRTCTGKKKAEPTNVQH